MKRITTLALVLAVASLSACRNDLTAPSQSTIPELQPFTATEISIPISATNAYTNSMSMYLPDGASVPDLIATSSTQNVDVDTAPQMYITKVAGRNVLTVYVNFYGKALGKAVVTVRHRADTAGADASSFNVTVQPDSYFGGKG